MCSALMMSAVILLHDICDTGKNNDVTKRKSRNYRENHKKDRKLFDADPLELENHISSHVSTYLFFLPDIHLVCVS